MNKTAPLVAVFFPLGVYLLTLAREITFTDSGELAAAAATLGIAHPPGYPLFVLLGRILTLLPVSSPAFRVGLVSASAAAGTSLLIYLVGGRLLRDHLPVPAALPAAEVNRGSMGIHSTSDVRNPRNLASSRQRIRRYPYRVYTWTPLVGALLFAFAKTPWSQAVVVEVYSLQAFLVAAFMLACVYTLNIPGGGVGHWPLVTFCFGLALTNHPTTVLLGPSLVIFLILSLLRRSKSSRRAPLPIWQALGAFFLPLLLYLYLPLRSRMSPDINWGYPDTIHRFLVHILARQYHGNLGSKGIQLVELKRFITSQLSAEATWLFVVLAMFGLVALLARSRGFGMISLLAVVSHLLYNMAYQIHDIHLYYLPVIAIMGIWASVGAGILARTLLQRSVRAGNAFAAALCLYCLVPLVSHWRVNDQHAFRLVAYFVRDTLRYTEDDAILFSGRWDSFVSPALYYQVVEGYRPDVVVVDLGSFARPTLERFLTSKAPDLAATCREEMAAVAEVGLRAESGQPYDVPTARRDLEELKRKLVGEAVKLRPSYVTSDLFRQPLVAGYHLITEGLVARVANVDAFRPVSMVFEGSDWNRGETRDPREKNILEEYKIMLLNRAYYLQRHGLMKEAAELTERADQILP